jgi:hypothetical protein
MKTNLYKELVSDLISHGQLEADKTSNSALATGSIADSSSMGWSEFTGIFSSGAFLQHLVNDGLIEKVHTFPSMAVRLTERGREFFSFKQ